MSKYKGGAPFCGLNKSFLKGVLCHFSLPPQPHWVHLCFKFKKISFLFQEGVIARDEDHYFLTTDRKGRSSDGENVILKLKSDTPRIRETGRVKTFSDLMDLDILSSVLQSRFRSNENEENRIKNKNDRNFEDTEERERNRKSTDHYVIETAVFVDQHLYEKLRDVFTIKTEEQIINMVMAMISSVSRKPNLNKIYLHTLQSLG